MIQTVAGATNGAKRHPILQTIPTRLGIEGPKYAQCFLPNRIDRRRDGNPKPRFLKQLRSNPMTSSTEQTATNAKRKAADMADQAKKSAQSAVDDAANAAHSQADAVKSNVADEVSGVASALRTAAEEMRSGSPQERTFGQIAEGLADASDALREKDLGTMVSDVSAFARKNPMVFLGGAALIGFAATRFAKASHDSQSNTAVQSDPFARHSGSRGEFS